MTLPPDVAERLIATAIKIAFDGDVAMLRALLPYCVPPPRREAPVRVDLPPLASTADAVAASAAIAAATADGRLTTAEAAGLAAVIGNFLKAVETADLERRLAALEARLAAGVRSVA